jgi:hypothetical protein
MEYEDLVIQLGAGAAGGYTVQVSRSKAGQSAPEPLLPPMSGDEIAQLVRAFGAAPDLLRPNPSEVSRDSLAALGERLFRSLLPEAVRDRYNDCVGRIADQGERGLRLRIQMGLGNPAMERLHTIPWEYLRTTETEGYFLALNRRSSIVRDLDLPLPGDRPPAAQPLSILAVACEDANLDFERECREIKSAWSGQDTMRFKLLRNATLDALREELLGEERRRGTYHVLHFIGHGGYDPAAGEGSLALCNEEGRRVAVSGGDLAEQVRDRTSLRLVVLNACWTARAGAIGPYAGVATALLNAGIPAVLAMQFPITDAAALAFSRAFYRRLARGDTIDAAVTEGRMAIRRQDSASLEWGTPVLFERLTNGRIVDAPPRRGRVRAAVAAAALAGSLGAVWIGLRVLPERFSSAPAAPGSAATEPAQIGMQTHQPGAAALPAAAPASGAADSARKPPAAAASAALATVQSPRRNQAPAPSPGSRIYSVTASHACYIAELATLVTVEFSQLGSEPLATLHLTPPHGPTVQGAVFGATTIGVDLQPGTGHLVVLSVDWSEQTVMLSAEPRGPPLGASAQCSDGLYSFSRTHRGTCSHHGSVLRWL